MADVARQAPRRTRRVLPLLASLLLACLLLAALAGCTGGPAPIEPYPDVARVPHPVLLDGDTPYEDLVEVYSTSPNRDPDGLGVLGTLWLNSRMTLITWPTARAREERNRIAYARDAAEQARSLAEARELYAAHWVFEGVLLGDLPAAVSVAFYQPEGVYLLDDRGRKFVPVIARDLEPLTADRASSEFGTAHYGFPRLVFPRAAITAETRAVSLYFAALNRRARFTWVFDPQYRLPAAGLGTGREQNRLFPAR